MTVILDDYREDDREPLLALKCAVFDGLRIENERRRFAWEFDDNPALDGRRPRAKVLREGDALVGSFAFVPCRVRVGGRVVAGAAGIDLCVAASHRGRGLAPRVVQPFWAPGMFEFPFSTGVNAASRHLFGACGATLLGGRDDPCAWAWFVDGARPDPPAGPRHAVAEVAEPPADWDGLWAAIAAERPLAIERDAAYLRWRYVRFPFERPVLLAARGGDGATRGLAVVQADAAHERLYLLELLALRGDAAALRGLLAAATDHARRSGHRVLHVSTRAADLAPALREAGFHPVPGDVPTYMGKHNPPDGRRPAIREWFVSLGDGDMLYNVGEPGSARP